MHTLAFSINEGKGEAVAAGHGLYCMWPAVEHRAFHGVSIRVSRGPGSALMKYVY
jgi:hypothetical protein